MTRKWFDNWDNSYDLSGGGIELSYRKGEIGTMLVETEAVRRVKQLTLRIERPGVSHRYYLVGERGYGKSTLLNFMAYSLYSNLNSIANFALPIYCTMLGDARDEQRLEFVFFNSLLTSLFDLPRDMQRLGIQRGKSTAIVRLDDAFKEYKKALATLGSVSLEYVYTACDNQLSHLSSEFKPIVFLIDGLDKYEPSLVLGFLKKTQERFSSIVSKYYCLFMFAGDPTWAETLESHEFTGVRGSIVSLRGWTTDEAQELIKKRLAAVSIFHPPFETGSLDLLVKTFRGNPRKILQYATVLIDYAARQHQDVIGPGLTKQLVWSEEQKSKLHKKIVEDADFRFAFEKLRPYVSSKEYISILEACYARGTLRKNMNYDERSSLGIRLRDEDFLTGLERLLDRGCLKFGATEDFVTMESDVKSMFAFVKEIGASVAAFPIVFEEFEATILPTDLSSRIDLLIASEVKSAFNSHSTEWLNAEKIREIILENPKRAASFKDRWGDEMLDILRKTIPLSIGQLRKDESLVFDAKTASYRWRGLMLRDDKDIVDIVRSSGSISNYEGIRYASERDAPHQVGNSCKSTIDSAMSELLDALGQEPASVPPDRRYTILRRLEIDVDTPISLEQYFPLTESLSTNPDTAAVLIATCKLYLIRIHQKINEVREKGAITYLAKIQDPPYYATLKTLESNLRECVEKELSKLDIDWWKTRVPGDVRENCEKRVNDRKRPYPWIELLDASPLHFADFPDYQKIICRSDNWRDSFETIFVTKETIHSKLQELEPIRNDIAHSRSISTESANLLSIYEGQITRAIKEPRVPKPVEPPK